jgi:SNF2-related domain
MCSVFFHTNDRIPRPNLQHLRFRTHTPHPPTLNLTLLILRSHPSHVQSNDQTPAGKSTQNSPAPTSKRASDDSEPEPRNAHKKKRRRVINSDGESQYSDRSGSDSDVDNTRLADDEDWEWNDHPDEDEQVTEEVDKLFDSGGTAFEKLDLYDKYLDDPNPWHPDLRRSLFPCQVIGLHWMQDRHALGGGLIADKVGTGKVQGHISSLVTDDQTFQAINFLLWLRHQAPDRNRHLALVVVFNKPLLSAWLDTLNNDSIEKDLHVFEKTHSQNSLNAEAKKAVRQQKEQIIRKKVWKDGTGLTVWDGSKNKPPKLVHGRVPADVILITASQLSQAGRRAQHWLHRLRFETLIADEAHEFLRGNCTSNAVSQTLQAWYGLLRNTRSAFLLTGTPFMTDIPFDVQRITQAIATDSVRGTWGQECTDEGLIELFEQYSRRGAEKTDVQQRIAEVLARYTLKRTAQTRIRGQPVITDFLGQCVRYEESLRPDPAGYEAAMKLINRQWGDPKHSTISPVHASHMRCMRWSHRYLQWCQRDKDAWKGFCLEEAQHNVRQRRLIQILRDGKKSGNGVLVFTARKFQSQLAFQVCHR